jgi:hypothetical protein
MAKQVNWPALRNRKDEEVGFRFRILATPLQQAITLHWFHDQLLLDLGQVQRELLHT